jgi:hypothetical protein
MINYILNHIEALTLHFIKECERKASRPFRPLVFITILQKNPEKSFRLPHAPEGEIQLLKCLRFTVILSRTFTFEHLKIFLKKIFKRILKRLTSLVFYLFRGTCSTLLPAHNLHYQGQHHKWHAQNDDKLYIYVLRKLHQNKHGSDNLSRLKK